MRTPKASPKWEKWAVESCKQSGRVWIPSFDVADSIVDVIREDETTIVARLGGDTVALRGVVSPARDINIVIGPEGDFSESELEILRGMGTTFVSLGESVFRSEVAAEVLGGLVLYELGRLG